MRGEEATEKGSSEENDGMLRRGDSGGRAHKISKKK